jgi:hypothetical protein
MLSQPHRLYSVECKSECEWWIRKARGCRELPYGATQQQSVVTKESHENIHEDIRPPNEVSNLGPPEYEVLTTRYSNK